MQKTTRKNTEKIYRDGWCNNERGKMESGMEDGDLLW